MKTRLENKIIELWHLSKVVSLSRYDRMIYVKTWLLKENSDLLEGLSPKRLWFTIEDTISPISY